MTDVKLKRSGSGDALVLLHGLAVTGDMFDPVSPVLGAKYELFVPDLPFRGRTGVGVGRVDMASQAADVVRALDAAGVEKMHVLGYSMGGTVAQEIARAHPDRIRSLTLAATFTRPSSAVSGAPLSWNQVYDTLNTGLTSRDREWLQLMINSNRRLNLVAAFSNFMAFDSTGWLAELSCSTLVIAGEKDTLSPPAEGKRLKDGIKGAKLVTLDNAGHMLILTHEKAFQDAVLKHLGENLGEK
jgi:pimeloyl-ACP methyl ester carboxylesterase